jgi:hypothetical protein
VINEGRVGRIDKIEASLRKEIQMTSISAKGHEKLEGETQETMKTGIITFRKNSASDIFTRLVSLYGFDKEKIVAGLILLRYDKNIDKSHF